MIDQIKLLSPCDQFWGRLEVREEAPRVHELRDAIYVPWGKERLYDHNPDWGVYASDRSLFEPAAYRRGEDRALLGQSAATAVDLSAAITLPDACYVYGGPLQVHFGHFLCSTLSRLWGPAEGRSEGRKILFHAHVDTDQAWAYGFVESCFTALGLRREDVVIVHEPAVVPMLLVPDATFEEQSFIRPAFARTARYIGDRVAEAPPLLVGETVYLSKTGVSSGVHQLQDEIRLESFLRREGVTIVHPETWSFGQQVGLFRSASSMIGMAGSALHTAAFSEPLQRVTALSPKRTVNSNLLLVDAVSGSPAQYWYPSNGVEETWNEQGFIHSARLRDQIEEVGRDLMNLSSEGSVAYRPPNNTNLDAIGTKYRTDKASYGSNYLDLYEQRMVPFHGREFSLIEIGVGEGGSLRMWAEFFPKARVFGVDIAPPAQDSGHERVSIISGDASRAETLDRVLADSGAPLIVVDDGSHLWHHQIETFRLLWPRLRRGGVYIIEAVHTSFPALAADYRGHSAVSTYDYLQQLQYSVVGDNALFEGAAPDGFIFNYARSVRAVEWSSREVLIWKR